MCYYMTSVLETKVSIFIKEFPFFRAILKISSHYVHTMPLPVDFLIEAQNGLCEVRAKCPCKSKKIQPSKRYIIFSLGFIKAKNIINYLTSHSHD
jgi:hypothetical protein